LIVTIESLAFGGDGIARHEGQVIFIPFTAPGDTVRIELTERKKSFARGRIVEMISASPRRLAAPCAYYGECGGCQYQHLPYEDEIAAKYQQIRDVLERIGKMVEPPVRPVLASPRDYQYRNRITVHAEEGRLGFRSTDGRTLVNVQKCLLAMPEVNDALRGLRRQQREKGHFSVRHPDLPPSGFYQTNQYQQDTLRTVVNEAIGVGGGTLVEGYCGGGFFTEFLASKFQEIIAIEKDDRSLRDAERMKIPHTSFVCADVAEQLPKVLQGRETSSLTVLVDPPREGLDAAVTRALTEHRASTLVYVSCNPSTLARDLLRLGDAYTVEWIQPIDLFPRTGHVECVARLVVRTA
jgi:23S rRNA (uracil1939-C5)-methyltransferase